MAQAPHPRTIGDFFVTEQIGSGSFAVVWRARHRSTGLDVAIKEIATDRLNAKLHESLRSEIHILQRTNHPNIIRLHDIVEAPNRIYLVLEFCAGGDLAAYIQQHGRVSEAIARHFMRQLGAGLQVLRANDLIHRDLKPQNLLLSTNDGNAILKIADFGFARSLQPQGMAETLCGSPLYMAPEILQFQKYDAKADLWSVGAILYQLVTGRPPFYGNNHVQLLQNIVKSNELRFPETILGELHPDCLDMCQKLLRRNPVERLSFEEFFNHKFMELQVRKQFGFVVDSTPRRKSFDDDISDHLQEEYLPFLLDEEPQDLTGSSKQNIFSGSPPVSFLRNHTGSRGLLSVGMSLSEKGDASFKQIRDDNVSVNASKEKDGGRKYMGSKYKSQEEFESGYGKASETEEVSQLTEGEKGSSVTSSSKEGVLMDSLDCIEQEYVLVNAPLVCTETLCSTLSDQSAGKRCQSPRKRAHKGFTACVPVSILSGERSVGGMGSTGSHDSFPFQGSLDVGEAVDKPSLHPPIRLHSLQNCSLVITELAEDKLDAGQYLEAFSIQLVCLAVWKEAMHVCHEWADAASDGHPNFGGGIGRMDHVNDNCDSKPSPVFSEESEADSENSAAAACLHVEQEFLSTVERAEYIASHLDILDGKMEMPDGVEIIFQSALAIGKSAAVDELMENVTDASAAYSKAVILLYFLLVEATSLSLNPPLVLSSSDRQRLRRYINILTTRQFQSTAQRVGLLQQQDQQSISLS